MLGLFLVYAHGYSGHWLQSSARMKSLWADTADSALGNYFLLLFVVAVSRSMAVFAGSAVIQVLVGLGMKVRSRGQGAMEPGDSAPSTPGISAHTWTALSGAIATLSYVVFFGTQNLAPQTWYASAFVVPLSLAIGIGFGRLSMWAPVPRLFESLFVVFVAVAGVGSLAESSYPRFPHQVNMLGAAQWLKEHPQDRRVAAFNAGLLSYFSETDVVNLDGLVNDDIYEYASRDALPDYLDAREIGYLLDYPGMWEQPSLQRRGGLGGSELKRRLRVEARIEPLVPKARWLRAHPILMRVVPKSST